MSNDPNLKVLANKGFQLTFENGWTVSVMFGYGNYCEGRYDEARNYTAPIEWCQELAAPNAEIAAWDSDGTWFDFGGDTVEGYCSPDKVGAFIAGIMQMDPAKPKKLTA